MRVLQNAGRGSRALLVGLVVCLVVGAVPKVAAGDTFLLKDGARIVGDLAEEITGPDRKAWIVVATPFGSTRFPKKSLKKHLRVDVAAKPLVCTSIMVSTIKGVVERSGDDGKNWTKISPRDSANRTIADLPINSPNSVVAPGQHVRTGADGEVDLDVGWGVIHVAASSHVALGTSKESTLRVESGRVGARLNSLPKGGEFRVETPQATMGVRGTTFAVGVDVDEARFAVEEGAVRVGDRDVAAGRALRVGTDGAASEGEPGVLERRVFDRLRDTIAIPRIDRIRVPGGKFDYRAGNSETTVKIEPFELARTEITNAQLRQFTEWTAKYQDHYFCHPDEPPGSSHAALSVKGFADSHPELRAWQEEFLTGDDQPASGVNWFTAYAFCAWIGAHLPSESKWNWAAQGATNTPDNAPGTILEQAWLLDNSGDLDAPPAGKPWPDDPSRIFHSRPVATRKPNRLGLHDMYGNAAEWVFDRARGPDDSVPDDGSPWAPAPAADDSTPESRAAGGVRVAQGGAYTDGVGKALRDDRAMFGMGPEPTLGFRPEFRDR